MTRWSRDIYSEENVKKIYLQIRCKTITC